MGASGEARCPRGLPRRARFPCAVAGEDAGCSGSGLCPQPDRSDPGFHPGRRISRRSGDRPARHSGGPQARPCRDPGGPARGGARTAHAATAELGSSSCQIAARCGASIGIAHRVCSPKAPLPQTLAHRRGARTGLFLLRYPPVMCQYLFDSGRKASSASGDHVMLAERVRLHPSSRPRAAGRRPIGASPHRPARDRSCCSAA